MAATADPLICIVHLIGWVYCSNAAYGAGQFYNTTAAFNIHPISVLNPTQNSCLFPHIPLSPCNTVVMWLQEPESPTTWTGIMGRLQTLSRLENPNLRRADSLAADASASTSQHASRGADSPSTSTSPQQPSLARWSVDSLRASSEHVGSASRTLYKYALSQSSCHHGPVPELNHDESSPAHSVWHSMMPFQLWLAGSSVNKPLHGSPLLFRDASEALQNSSCVDVHVAASILLQGQYVHVCVAPCWF